MERIRVKPEQIQKVIEKEEPDFIFLTGDYYDKPKSKEKRGEAHDFRRKNKIFENRKKDIAKRTR